MNRHTKINLMNNQISQKPFSQRQLRVGELVKQNLGELLIRNEAKIPNLNSKFTLKRGISKEKRERL